eukprot:CAMPEP_0198683052 /NCGR_PEP_ID=MMETSP1468-20131203/9935_1 /TAXON_ID=1461545 /ORGANISM="Mantoniella sp, Strain CCMP1436" /LENGTH=76 /DNA_ID=CAMNT_0044426687 /DNA_START=56 /DNA_END=283 /DNA_ORIENTATION=-
MGRQRQRTSRTSSNFVELRKPAAKKNASNQMRRGTRNARAILFSALNARSHAASFMACRCNGAASSSSLSSPPLSL